MCIHLPIRVDQNRMASNRHCSELQKNNIRRLASVLDLDPSLVKMVKRTLSDSCDLLRLKVFPNISDVRWIQQCVRCAGNPSGSKTRGLCTQKVLGLREEQLHSVGLSFPRADIAWNGKGLGKWKRVEHSRMIRSLAHRLNAGPSFTGIEACVII